MRVGSIIYATEQGLGYLAKDFFDNGIINKVLIQEHNGRKNHREWYPRESVVASEEELLESCDTLIFFETPHNWKIIPRAREKGIKTILIPMYECTRYPNPYQCDVILSPSLLDKQYYPDSDFVPIPIPNWVEWRLREKALVFVHNTGNGGLGGRNGTKELIEAMKYVVSPIKLIIRTQSLDIKCDDPRVEIVRGSVDNKELYKEGDVFIFPEKFNGLSLPLQEAFASGMMVMCGDRFPMNTWLPKDTLIPVSDYKKERISVEFDSAIITPQDIARAIDFWYDWDIKKFSLLGKEFKEKLSWKNLKEKYEEYL